MIQTNLADIIKYFQFNKDILILIFDKLRVGNYLALKLMHEIFNILKSIEVCAIIFKIFFNYL